jgi:purine nucleoside phosphorylase
VISRGSALERVIGFGGHAAVVFGSGLAGLPRGARVEVELGYSELGWPCTDVPGHANLLRLVSVPMPVRETRSPAARESPAAVVGTPATAPGARLRLVLACGRPHHYEGWSRAELGRPVADLAAAGVRRLVLTNSCGALCPAVVPGDMISCHEVVDLQAPPRSGEPERLRVCDEAEALAVGAVVRRVVAADASSRVAVDARSGAPASAGAGRAGRTPACTWPFRGLSSRRRLRSGGWLAAVRWSACPRRRSCALRTPPAPPAACWDSSPTGPPR